MSNAVTSVGYGKENWKTHGVRIAAFVVVPPFKRDFPSKVLKRRGNTQQFPASEYPAINGTLFMDTVESRTGDVIMVQASRTWNGARAADAAVFFRVRENGPMITCHVLLLPEPGRMNGDQFVVFQGRGDILDGDDLDDLGYEIPSSWMDAYMDEDEIDEIMNIEVVGAQEAPPKPEFRVVENTLGQRKVVTVERQRRRIKVR